MNSGRVTAGDGPHGDQHKKKEGIRRHLFSRGTSLAMQCGHFADKPADRGKLVMQQRNFSNQIHPPIAVLGPCMRGDARLGPFRPCLMSPACAFLRILPNSLRPAGFMARPGLQQHGHGKCDSIQDTASTQTLARKDAIPGLARHFPSQNGVGSAAFLYAPPPARAPLQKDDRST